MSSSLDPNSNETLIVAPNDIVIMTTNLVNVTSPIIIADYQRRLASATQETKDLSPGLSLQQYQNELQLTSNVDQTTLKCPKQNIIKSLPTIDFRQLKLNVTHQFYNLNVLAVMSCLTDAIVTTLPISDLLPNERIHQWIDQIKLITADSVSSDTFMAQIQNVNLFVIKVPKNPSTSIAYHEYFVGLSLNTLRQKIPNFAYIYGIFKCSPPVFDVEGRLSTWCHSEGPQVHYIMYEPIEDSVPMQEYVATCSGNDFLNVYLQVLYASSEAYLAFDFTHYDIHTKNVLIRKIYQPQFFIEYTTENGLEYLLANRIATIIDYEDAHITIQTANSSTASSSSSDGNQSFGSYNKLVWNVRPDVSYPMYDAYKLLMTSMLDAAKANNQDVLKVGQVIFQFFNQQETLIDAIQAQANYFFYLPSDDQLMNLTYLDMARYIRANFDLTFFYPGPYDYPLLQCTNSNLCISQDGLLCDIKVNQAIELHDIYDFYDIISVLVRQGKEEQALELIRKFPRKSQMDQAVHEFEKLANDLYQRLNNFVIQRLEFVPVANLLNQELISEYRKYYYQVGQVYHTFKRLQLLQKAINYLASTDNSFKENLNVRSVRNYDLAIFRNTINYIITTIHQDRDYIQNILNTNPLYAQQILNSPVFEWYAYGLGNLGQLTL